MDLMIDLETLGLKPNATIMQIGWCTFDLNGERPTPCAITVNPQTHIDLGATVDWGTISWWMKPEQAEALRSIQEAEAHDIHAALILFCSMLPPMFDRVWANGAAFDFPIIENAFRACSFDAPWQYSQVMDMRTVRRLYPNVPQVRPNIPHNAGSDAVAQAMWLQDAIGGAR